MCPVKLESIFSKASASSKLWYLCTTHYSKSQIFVQKFNFDKTPTFSQVFLSNFFDNFSREIKVVQNHNIFTSFSPQKIDNFLGKSKLNFWTKNEDFEECIFELLNMYLKKCPGKIGNFVGLPSRTLGARIAVHCANHQKAPRTP